MRSEEFFGKAHLSKLFRAACFKDANFDSDTSPIMRTEDLTRWQIDTYRKGITMAAEETKDAAEELKWNLSEYVKITVGMRDQIAATLTEVRGLRFAVGNEVDKVMRSLKDVREFLSDAKHDADIARLKELCVVCERMKALKDSGFLDSVVDTILKVSPDHEPR